MPALCVPPPQTQSPIEGKGSNRKAGGILLWCRGVRDPLTVPHGRFWVKSAEQRLQVSGVPRCPRSPVGAGTGSHLGFAGHHSWN